MATDSRVGGAVALLAGGSGARSAVLAYPARATKNNAKDIGLGFDCRVLFLRAQCAINIESPNDKLNTNLSPVANELAKVRDKGLSEEEFTALVAQKISNCKSCSRPTRVPILTF